MKAGSDEQKKQGVWRVWCSCLGKSDNIVVRSQDCWHFWPGMVPATWVKAVLDTVVEGKLGTSPCSIPHLVPRGMCLLLSFVPLEGQFSSVQFSYSVVSDSLRPHESQHARPPCSSPTPGVHSDSRPSSRWCHPAISSSVVPFSSCPQSLPASESFPMSQLFSWGGQTTGVSALASFLPKNIQGWSPLEWTGWISLQSRGLSRVFSNTTLQKHQFFGTQLSLQSNSHPYMTTRKTIALTRQTLLVMSLLFNTLSWL